MLPRAFKTNQQRQISDPKWYLVVLINRRLGQCKGLVPFVMTSNMLVIASDTLLIGAEEKGNGEIILAEFRLVLNIHKAKFETRFQHFLHNLSVPSRLEYTLEILSLAKYKGYIL